MNHSLHPADVAELRRMLRKIDGLRGHGITNTPHSVSAGIPSRRREIFIDGDDLEQNGIFRVNSLIPLTQTDGFVIYKCRRVLGDGSELTADFPIWTRPDVSINDLILGLPVGTGLTFGASAPFTPVTLMQPGADLSSPFKVYLTQNGGSNGNKSTNCSYTYDVYITSSPKDSTTKIGSALAPEWRYLSKCQVTAATKGQASYVNGDVVLEIAYETLTSNSCS